MVVIFFIKDYYIITKADDMAEISYELLQLRLLGWNFPHIW